MKRDKLDNALYQPIRLFTKDGEVHNGYLVRGRYNHRLYSILPLDTTQGIYSFPASIVTQYQFYSNEVTIK